MYVPSVPTEVRTYAPNAFHICGMYVPTVPNAGMLHVPAADDVHIYVCLVNKLVLDIPPVARKADEVRK